MHEQRHRWARGQQTMRRLLLGADVDEGIQLWLRQHAALHAGGLAGPGARSFEDVVLDGLSAEQARLRVERHPHSIAWLIWHVARIEDVTMNVLVAGGRQVLDVEGWSERLGLSRHDVGTGMADAEVAAVGARLRIEPLRAYRLAVGRRSQEMVAALEPTALRRMVEPGHIEALLASGALPEAARGLADTWAGWRIARFLLMPSTRHAFTHLNEALRVRRVALKQRVEADDKQARE